MRRTFLHTFKFSIQHIHVMAQLSIHHTGINLCGLNVGVSEHLGHALNGNAFGKADFRRKRMPGKMVGDPLVDLANSSYLRQIFIHLLVTDYRKQSSIFQLALVFGENIQRYLQ